MVINNNINLSKTDYCNTQCNEIIDDVEKYLKLSKDNDDFELAVINLKEYKTFDDFLIAIGRKRRGEYRRAKREGFYTKILLAEERNDRREELFAINTSTEERQGKMSDEYLSYPKEVKEYTCQHHFQKTYAVFTPDNTWIGYVYPRFCGEVVRVYRILGHAKHMGKINFMILLLFDVVKDLIENHPDTKYFMYHLMNVGSQGLIDWKKNAGFKPTRFLGDLI